MCQVCHLKTTLHDENHEILQASPGPLQIVKFNCKCYMVLNSFNN